MGVQIDSEDFYNGYNLISVVNKMLEENGTQIKFVWDNEEHDGFDILHLVKEKSDVAKKS